MSKKSKIAIIGRPNVGKSTLFNRLSGKRTSIVDQVEGVTRDRIYSSGEWLNKGFDIIDTGGFVSSNEDIFNEKIKEQINHIEIIYYKTTHAHKTKKEEILRHLLQLSFHLIDDVWEELESYLTKRGEETWT